MAKQVESDPSAGRINRTPAPDEVSQVRSPSGAGYGQNNDLSGSSVPVGRRVVSPLGLNIEQSVNDPALQEVIAHGAAGRDDQVPAQKSEGWQQRSVDAAPYPITRGMKAATPGPKIPGALVSNEGTPDKKLG